MDRPIIEEALRSVAFEKAKLEADIAQKVDTLIGDFYKSTGVIIKGVDISVEGAAFFGPNFAGSRVLEVRVSLNLE